MKCSSCASELAPGAAACASCGAASTGAPAADPSEAPRPSSPNTAVSQRALRPISNREEKTVLPVRVNDELSGRYRLTEKIGEGGMGTVYTAHDKELDRKVAVKLLAANLVNDEEVVERFEREARLTASLDHPNIIPIYDVGRHEGRPYIVMKLLEGDTLAGILRTRGGFTSDETVRLMKQLAAGLDYIHAKGFIHRDIKAGNIFIGNDGHATILDFGILRPKSGTQGLTRTGMVMGTPHYMAPEQALGLRDVDHRVDIYALAVVLFECLTGTLPFEAESELRLIQMQAHSPPPDIIERAPWISKPVAEAVSRALAKRPDDRYASGADLVKALEAAYLASKGHEAAPAQPAPAVSPHTAPSWRRAQDVAASPPIPAPLATPAAKAIDPVVLPRPSAPSPDTDELRRAVKPSRTPVAMLALAALAALVVGGWWYASSTPVENPVAAVVDAGAARAVPDAAAAEVSIDAGSEVAVAAGDVPDAGEPAVPDAGAELAVVKTNGKKKNGKVNVITTHEGEPYWAQVSIDGVPKGRTPLLLDLPVGKYQVLVERSGFKPQTREIRVASGKSVVVRIDLIP